MNFSKKRRVFAAVNLPEDVKRDLQKISQKFALPEVRLTPKDNLHFTLVFLGHISDDELLEVIGKTKAVAQRYRPFEIDFTKIDFGPPGKKPRMIWAEAEKNEKLARLKTELENALAGFIQKRENRAFHPHLTLARFPEGLLEQNDFQPFDINLSAPIDAVEIMESILKRNELKYEALESVKLGPVN